MKKKKWKDIRSAVTMMCVMLAMISTATYAWFTMSESATVTGLQMTAVTNGGLMVSTNRSSWSNAVDLRTDGEAVKVLTPVSVVKSDVIELSDGTSDFYSPQFQMPEYSDPYTVAGLYEITGNGNINDLLGTDANLGTKAVKKTFYIKTTGTEDAHVGIEIGDAKTIAETLKNTSSAVVGLTNGKPSFEGSFVVLNQGSYTNTNVAADDALEAVRIGLVIYDETNDTATLKIWEPNCDLEKEEAATYADNAISDTYAALTPDVSSNFETATIASGASTYDTKISKALFDIAADDTDGVRVDVYMWFEGQDPSCVNEIMADSIIAQLKFVALTN